MFFHLCLTKLLRIINHLAMGECLGKLGTEFQNDRCNRLCTQNCFPNVAVSNFNLRSLSWILCRLLQSNFDSFAQFFDLMAHSIFKRQAFPFLEVSFFDPWTIPSFSKTWQDYWRIWSLAILNWYYLSLPWFLSVSFPLISNNILLYFRY